MNLPCWYKPKAKAVAEVLLKAGYSYCGLTENFIFYEEYSTQCGQWRIAPTVGECCLDVEHDGGLFSLSLEAQHNPNFNREIRRLKHLIRTTEKTFDDELNSQYLQLTLF